MRKSIKRLPATLKSAFGMTENEMSTVWFSASPCLILSTAWGTVRCGRDRDMNDVVLVNTPYDTFALCETLPASVMDRASPKRRTWVLALRNHPDELFEGTTPATLLTAGGFYVCQPADKFRASYLSIVLPGGDLTLVVRNPATGLVLSWAPSLSRELSPLSRGHRASVDHKGNLSEAERNFAAIGRDGSPVH